MQELMWYVLRVVDWFLCLIRVLTLQSYISGMFYVILVPVVFVAQEMLPQQMLSIMLIFIKTRVSDMDFPYWWTPVQLRLPTYLIVGASGGFKPYRKRDNRDRAWKKRNHILWELFHRRYSFSLSSNLHQLNRYILVTTTEYHSHIEQDRREKLLLVLMIKRKLSLLHGLILIRSNPRDIVGEFSAIGVQIYIKCFWH